jgi:3-methyladenine DNA glycosylase/8-oxoguanine DNA glycosylase
VPLDGRPLVLRPDPQLLARLNYADFHRFGIERRRAEAILRVCRRAASLDRFAHDDGVTSGDRRAAAEVATAAMESLPGIGPWTSATVVQQAFGTADTVIVGDYHLPNIVAYNLAGEPRATDARMLELLAPYAPHRGRVVRLLARGGRHAPRRAPGRRLRSIASI